METLFRDVRLSFKRILKEKTFSATVLLTLAICIGANVTIFSVIQTVLLQPLPFFEPHRLVTINNSYPGAGVERASNGATDFFFRRERIEAFQEVAAFQGAGNTVGEAGGTERVASLRVTPSFFPLLGIELALGRGFTEDEMDVGNHQKVVLTHGYWQEYYGGSADVLGRELRVGGLPFTVVGVLREDFRIVGRADGRFLLPINTRHARRSETSNVRCTCRTAARLRTGLRSFPQPPPSEC